MFSQCAAREGLGQQHPVAAEKVAGFGQCQVTAYKIRRRYAVAVNEDHILGLGRGERTVARCARAEAKVFLPDVAQGEIRLFCILLNKLSRVASRPVIRNQYLEAVAILVQQSFQNGTQRVRPVIGGGDDRSGGHDFLSQSSISFR